MPPLSEKASRRIFWTILSSWFLCLLLLVLLPAFGRGSRLAEAGFVAALVMLALLPIYLAWILLFRRSSTGFPKCTRFVGGLICALYLSLLVYWLAGRPALRSLSERPGQAYLPSEGVMPPHLPMPESSTENSRPVIRPSPPIGPPSQGSNSPGSSIPDPTSRALRLVDELVSELRDGNLAHDIPRGMERDELYVVTLLVSPSASAEVLVARLSSTAATSHAGVRVGERMEAKLSGASFEIRSITPSLQAVGLGEPTEWRWEVKPLRSGIHNLHLDLSVLLTVSGTTTPRSIKTFAEKVTVSVELTTVLSAFLQSNWQWLWAAVLVPAAVWLWKRRTEGSWRSRPNRLHW